MLVSLIFNFEFFPWLSDDNNAKVAAAEFTIDAAELDAACALI